MKVQVGFRIEQEVIDALDRLAAKEVRNRSNMVEFILVDYLRAHDPDFQDIQSPDEE